MFKKNKNEIIPLKDFISRESPIHRKEPPKHCIHTFFPPITLKSFLPVSDPAFALFLIAGGVITVIALLERVITGHGYIEISGSITVFIRLLLSFVSYGLIFWFLLQL